MLNICKLTLAIVGSFIASFLIIYLITIALGFVPSGEEKSAMEISPHQAFSEAGLS